MRGHGGTWAVGFTWQRGQAFLCEDGSAKGSIRLRLPLQSYTLQLHPALEARGVKPAYLRFADLANAPVDALLRFAEAFGLLGLHEASMKRLSEGARVYAGVLDGLGHSDEAGWVMARLSLIEGAYRWAEESQKDATLPESVEEWRHHARQMHRVIAMLEKARRLPDAQADTLLEAAAQYVNGHLEGPARLIRVGDEWRLTPEPATLLEALWVQLALSMLYAEEPRQCPACGEWFSPTRRDQVTCSQRCRWRRQKRNQRRNQGAGSHEPLM